MSRSQQPTRDVLAEGNKLTRIPATYVAKISQCLWKPNLLTRSPQATQANRRVSIGASRKRFRARLHHMKDEEKAKLLDAYHIRSSADISRDHRLDI